jgi:hypothetical protein
MIARSAEARRNAVLAARLRVVSAADVVAALAHQAVARRQRRRAGQRQPATFRGRTGGSAARSTSRAPPRAGLPAGCAHAAGRAGAGSAGSLDTAGSVCRTRARGERAVLPTSLRSRPAVDACARDLLTRDAARCGLEAYAFRRRAPTAAGNDRTECHQCRDESEPRSHCRPRILARGRTKQNAPQPKPRGVSQIDKKRYFRAAASLASCSLYFLIISSCSCFGTWA